MTTILIHDRLGPFTVTPSLQGAKNAALPVIAAASLIGGKTRLDNIPRLTDVHTLLRILRGFGVEATWLDKNLLQLQRTRTGAGKINSTLSRQMRGSIYAVVAGLNLFGHCISGPIGGDELPGRNLRPHQRAYEEFGLSFTLNETGIQIDGGPPRYNDFYLNDEGISASCTALILASMCSGTSVIRRISREPEVHVLAKFLTNAGASIKVVDRTAKVTGPLSSENLSFRIPSDRIVAGTWAILAAITGGEVVLRQSWATRHSGCLFEILERTGVKISYSSEDVIITRSSRLHSIDVETDMYPGFPTDLLPQLTVMLALTDGDSYVTERVYKGRFEHIPYLVEMGAMIDIVSDKTIRIRGPSSLVGTTVRGSGIRETAALILAGLVAEGSTTVLQASALARGYEREFVRAIAEIPADLTIIPSTETREWCPTKADQEHLF